MLSPLVRSRPATTALTLAVAALTLAGCSLGDSGSLPPFTDPATQVYDASTNVTIAAMTRTTPQVFTQDVTTGTGRTVATGDSISVYYTGKLSTGFQFDARTRPSVVFSTVLDSTRLISGWVIGLAGMKVGGIRRVVIGPENGYQFRAVTGQPGGPVIIPPNSVLVFEVEATAAFARP